VSSEEIKAIDIRTGEAIETVTVRLDAQETRPTLRDFSESVRLARRRTNRITAIASTAGLAAGGLVSTLLYLGGYGGFIAALALLSVSRMVTAAITVRATRRKYP